jgi:hypothetical protein
MNAAFLVAVLAGAISVVGWFVSHLLTMRADRRRARLAARTGHVEKQLAELYGPLAFLVYEGRASFGELLRNLGRHVVFPPGRPLPEDELRTWLFWVDQDLMPRNAAIQKLLSTKTHLIVDGDLPASYIAFIDHYNAWRVPHERWKEEGVPYSWHSKNNWPKDFDDDVLETFRALMQKHAELIGAAGRA